MPEALAPGHRLERYELLCPIAQGGMASVWLARLKGKHGFEKLFAVKTILPQFAGDDRFRSMFLDEGRIAARIEHVNVAQILDLGEEDGRLYMVMEWIDGESVLALHRILERKQMRIPPGVALRILADACGGLHAAHELHDAAGAPLHVVHRDVSPQNMLIAPQGITKLIDFGVAKAKDRAVGDTNAGDLKGKIRFMAPEQAASKDVDRRADVWGIGATLHYLLSGAGPFDAHGEAATLGRLLSDDPPAPLPEGTHPALARVVARALERDPARRYASCAELQRALLGAMAEANLPTTNADVAELLALHTGDRQRDRKKVIAKALDASRTRESPESSASYPSSTIARAAMESPSRSEAPRKKSWALIASLGVFAVVLVAGLVAVRATQTREPPARPLAAPPPDPPRLVEPIGTTIATPPPTSEPSATPPSVASASAAPPKAAPPPRKAAPAPPAPPPPPAATAPTRRDYGF